jgi:diaminopimelate epimerase
MKHAIRFTKASGAGNDFILLDNRSGRLPEAEAALARTLCSRPFGVGADGLLVLEPSTRADFLMKYYNADGSFGGMCGNGGRCIARFAHAKGMVGRTMRFEALDHIYRAECLDNVVRLEMKDPGNLEADVRLAGEGLDVTGQFIDTGSPHYVMLASAIEPIDVAGLGRRIRNHSRFKPDGTNVDWIARNPDGSLAMRTYERGVEAETLACGTGSVAVAAVGLLQLGLSSPVTVRARSGEQLVISLTRSGNRVVQPVLEGSAHLVFEGTLMYDDETFSLS